MLPLPLEGVRVLDRSTRLAGAYAAKMLRDAGAEVAFAETPEQPHPLRRRSPVVPLAPGEDGALFLWLQGGKASVDLAAHPELAQRADIVIEDEGSTGPPGAGVTVTITDFGAGPWAARPCSHLTLEAESGSLGSRGVPELPPVAVGGALGEWIAGVYTATAALAAWRTVRGSGVREHVEVSLFECMLVTLNMHEPLHAALSGSDAFLRWVQVPSVEPAADGWVCFSLVTGQQWLDFAAMIERPDLGADASLSNMLGRWPRRSEVYAAMDPWLRSRTVEEIVDIAGAFRLPVAHVTDGSTVAEMAHFRQREVFASSPHGGHPQPKPPYRFSANAVAGPAPAPAVAADTESLVRRWSERRSPHAAHAPRRPLDGVRIVDLTAFWAGPSGSHYLTALGADVIKVESVQRPDGIRFAGGQITRDDGWWEWSWVFQGANAGKRGVTLDLTRDEGRDLVHRLLATADVLMENYSPRVMAQFGLTWEALSAAYPSLVVTRMPAFGLDGPWADRVGFALTMEALAGMATVTGHPEGRPTCPGGVLDPIAGMHAVYATLVALEHRDRTGEGQLVEVPMIESALNVAAEPLLEWGAHGVVVPRRGNRAWDDALQDVYRCAGDESWVAVTIDTEERAAAVAAVLAAAGESAQLPGPDWRRPGSRLDEALRAFLATAAAEEAVGCLVAAGVPAGVVRRPTVVAANPHVTERGFFEPHEHPVLGRFGYPVLPTRFSTWAGPVWPRPAPTLGEHNREVLGAELGVGADQLSALERDGIIGTRPAGL